MDEFFFFLSDQYNIARRAVDNSGKVECWWLRSVGANDGYAAHVFGDCRGEDEFDHGDICDIKSTLGYKAISKKKAKKLEVIFEQC